jgi:transcriptional/translational regulatory protein YebC/TACO1
LNEAGVEADSSELAYLPNNVVQINDEDSAKKVLKLVESLEELEDVKAVHGNYDMDESLLEAISG